MFKIKSLNDNKMLCGMPVKQYEMCKPDNSECIWVNENMVPHFQALGYTSMHNIRMTYAAPDWIVGRDNEPVVLLLDDANRAQLNILQACMEIIDRQSYASWALPKGSTVILTNNPDKDGYQVTTTDDAHLTRRIKLNMEFDAEDWSEWAESNGILPICIAFILKYKDVVSDRYNARLWTKFFQSLKGLGDLKSNVDMIRLIGQATLPIESLGYFTQFIAGKLADLPELTRLFTDEDKDYKAWLHKVQDCIQGDGYKADIAYIVATRLTNIMNKNEQPSDRDKARVTDLFEVDGIFRPELYTVTMRRINPAKWGVLKSEKIRKTIVG